jgi:hypothetical protein
LRIIIEIDEGKTTTAITPSNIQNVEIVGNEAHSGGGAPIGSLETSRIADSSSFDKENGIDAGPPAQSLLEMMHFSASGAQNQISRSTVNAGVALET